MPEFQVLKSTQSLDLPLKMPICSWKEALIQNSLQGHTYNTNVIWGTSCHREISEFPLTIARVILETYYK